MSPHEFVAVVGPDTAEVSITVIGTPFHRDADAMEQAYRSGPFEEFLAHERRFGVGNYLLVERSGPRLRVITSPGYEGGYYFADQERCMCATFLGEVLCRLDRLAMDRFGVAWFVSDAPHSAFNQMPFTTPFEGIFRLSPASVFEWAPGRKPTHRTYLASLEREQRPQSFEAALHETAKSIVAYAKQSNTSLGVMFSGGVDSLSILLALQHAGYLNPHAVTIDHNRTNGPSRAFSVAQALSIDLDYVANSALDMTEIASITERCMDVEICPGMGPNFGLASNPKVSNHLMVHGQNMDAVSHINMTVLEKNLNAPIFSPVMVREANTDKLVRAQMSTFLSNLAFTDEVLKDVTYQRNSAAMYAAMLPGVVIDPDPGRKGILRGMISSQHPNLIYAAGGLDNQTDHLDREIDLFRDWAACKMASNAIDVQLARFASYAALSNKRICAPEIAGVQFLLAAQSGPILSYFLGKPRLPSDTLLPKGEIYRYARKMTGRSYRDIAKHYPYETPPRVDVFMRNNRDLLDGKGSAVLPLIADTGVRKFVADRYDAMSKHYQGDYDGTEDETMRLARRIINMERLVRHATVRRSSKA